ncbi:unnamed protein product [Auanema sp. JU1783]|nr:unnamed protein product [Auanema sp. JU1783]
MKLTLFLATIAVASAVNCPADTVYDNIMNRCYEFVISGVGFQQAQEYCLSRSGILVSIHNGTENFYLAESGKQQFSGNKNYWIGLSNIPGKWSWTDGSSLTYTSWSANEPGNSTNVCAYSNTVTASWTHANCENVLPFICSYDANPTTPQAPTTTHGPKCPSDQTYNLATDSCYYVGTSAGFWSAESMCVALGGHLTSIHSSAENLFVMGLTSIGGTRKADEMTWIGLHYTGKDWIWSDGTEVTYRNWEPGMPSDVKSDQCVELLQDDYSKKKNVKGTWNNQPCNWNMRKFVCKVKTLW